MVSRSPAPPLVDAEPPGRRGPQAAKVTPLPRPCTHRIPVLPTTTRQTPPARVDYHFGLGFHTIYLIDNSDDHELRPWQDKRRAAGYNVRVMPKPGTHRQMYGYHMCAAEHRHEHTYMAFFDVGEARGSPPSTSSLASSHLLPRISRVSVAFRASR